MLQLQLRLHIRPYETGAGDTDRAYYACLDRLVEVVEAKGDVERAVIGMVEAMRAVPVDRSRPRPLIGLVGEAYLRNVKLGLYSEAGRVVLEVK